MKKLALVVLLSGDLIACTGAGVGLGYWAWQKWQAGWLTALCSLAGLCLGFYRLFVLSSKLVQKEEQDLE